MTEFNPSTSNDSEPDPGPSLPPTLPTDLALWDDADLNVMRGPAASFGDPPPGDRDDAATTIGHIGRYALKHRLGEGGLGTVYAAHDPLLSRLIAVKTLNVEIPDQEREAFNALFLNEARAAGGLSHPHIVTVFDAGISDHRAYIAMELLKGRDLRQLREEGWRATPAQAALIVRRIADALGYAHSKGVVHRDVKPANIFMIGRTQPKVLDFGIARVAHRHDAGDIAAGSPYYMSPEQVRQQPVDRRSDVFSLGVLLYELLTDNKPFRGGSLEEITNAVLEHEPLLAHEVDPGVPVALSEITARAMAKNPDLRYRSARAFSRDLRHWLDSNTVSSDGDVQATPAARPRTAVVVAAGAGVLLLGGLLWSALGPRSPQAGAGASAPTALVTPAVATAPTASPAAALSPGSAASTTLPAAEAGDRVAAGSVGAPASGASGVPAIAAVTAPVERPATPRDLATKRAIAARDSRGRETRPASSSTPVAPPPTGLVLLAISPWGAVEVDGRAVGTSPPLTELRLAQGRHQIVIRNTDLLPHIAHVDVTADQPVTLKHRF